MTVEFRALPSDAALIHVILQPGAQHLSRRSLAADTDREMPAPRKYPDVAFQPRQKLNVDVILGRRHIVAERAHSVLGAPLGANVAQRVARAGRHHAEISFGHTTLRT